jgi:hypothetical protein
MENGLIAFSLLTLGYRDYRVSRYLLNNENNDYVIQGLTFASTSIEKYIKVLLFLNGKTKSQINVHLNKLEQLKRNLSSCYYDITHKIDERFLEILGKVYEIRYYDDIKKPVTIGLFLNQFIGELDSAVNLFENVVIKDIRDDNGSIIKSPYHRDIESKHKDLFENNYILNGISKKEHMEKEDTGFAIYIDPNSLALGEIKILGKGIKNIYHGQMTGINIELNKK